MTETKRSIFRDDAVQRYIQGREKAVLPHFVSPRTFLYLWSLMGLLVPGAFTAWCARVPVYASGAAVVVAGRSAPYHIRAGLVLLAFLPAEDLTRLRVGQRLFAAPAPAGGRLSGSVMAIEPKIVSPAMARTRFTLHAGAAWAVSQPSAVVLARLTPLSSGLPPSAYAGGIYDVDVEVGARRVLSLLPLVGAIFGE